MDWKKLIIRYHEGLGVGGKKVSTGSAIVERSGFKEGNSKTTMV